MNMRYHCIHACENAQGVKTAMRTAVHRTSGFPASAETVFSELQKLQTLQKVAAPWASFVQVQPNQDTFWKAGIEGLAKGGWTGAHADMTVYGECANVRDWRPVRKSIKVPVRVKKKV